VQDEQPVPGHLDPVLHAERRGATTAKEPAGRISVEQPHLAGQLGRGVDLDVALVAVSPTPSQNFSSALLEDDDVDEAGVPTVCRQTRYGRHASSTVT
jgi:hypothetical protein